MIDMDDYRVWLAASNASQRTITSRIQGARRLLALSRVDDVRQIQPLDVARYVASVPAGQSRATYYQHAAALARFIDAMTSTPATFMQGVPRPAAQRGLPRPIPRHELVAALAAATKTQAAMLLLAAYEGLRVSEIAAVRGQDITADDVYVLGKGGKPAAVPTHPYVLELRDRFPISGAWFTSDGVTPVHRVTAWEWMKQPLRAVGSSATPHQLRHFYGTELLRGGANVRTVQQLLRHASLASTEVYTQVVDADRRRAVEGLPLIA